MSLKFGLNVMTTLPPDAQRARWQRIEELGFDQILLGDVTHETEAVEIDGRIRAVPGSGYFLDGWTMLADLALHTRKVRIGTLVTSPVIRPPALCAMEAAAVDQLSGGRLELGIGLGMAYDHLAMGVEHWKWPERAARFREYVRLVDLLLHTREGNVEFEGEYYRTSQPVLDPGPLQARVPIHSAGASGTAVRVAAEIGEVWHGTPHFDDSPDEAFERVRKCNELFERHSEKHGRDPAKLRRSLLLLGSISPWSGPDNLERYVTRFGELGFTEFLMEMPPGREAELERIARAIPALKGES